MRKYVLWFFTCIVLAVLLLPAFLVRIQRRPRPRPVTGLMVRLYIVEEKKTVTLELEEYLVGVLAAEMPANFHLEALKAQAVAARTFTVRRMKCFGGAGSRHNREADFSDDPADGQAWLDTRDLKEKWGIKYGANLNKIRQAVSETSGLLAYYDGHPIEAIYHSTCGGRTESAVDVWGRQYPYLVGVPCDLDSHAPRYRATLRIPLKKVAEALKMSTPPTRATTTGFQGALNIRVLEQTITGRVQKLSVNGAEVNGEQFRQILGLNSPRFRHAVSGQELVITTIGYGHGVGLCQYGADGMAKTGKTFQDILRYYYYGTQLVKIVSRS